MTRGRVSRLVAMTLAGAVLLSLGSPAVAVLASPGSHVVMPTSADKKVLEATFIAYKLHTNGMIASDKIKWSRVRPSDPLAPLVAYDASDHRYWALANFALVLPASYKAEVSFQDGGSYGVYVRTVSGHWRMKGYAGVPLCPSIVPPVVAHLWHLVHYGGC